MAGIALLFVAAGVAVSTLVSLFNQRVDSVSLLLATVIVGFAGLLLFTSTKLGKTDQASIFTAVGTTWLIVSLFGTIPYLLAGTFSRTGIGIPE
ncbi:hypothetical protein OAJ92_00125, partial [bacterium]|nr:hypothetical protein [bacterium]